MADDLHGSLSSEQEAYALLKPVEILLQSGDPELLRAAIPLTRQACKLRPEDSWCNLQAARALYANADRGAALQALQGAKKYISDGKIDLTLVERLQKTWESCLLLTLPNELLHRILSFLRFDDIASAESTCKRLYSITTSSPELWRNTEHLLLDWTLRFGEISYRKVDAERMKEASCKLLRRVDGKLRRLSLQDDNIDCYYDEALLIKILKLVNPEMLVEIRLSSGDPFYYPVLQQLERICSGSKMLETLKLHIKEDESVHMPMPHRLWPMARRPPLKTLELFHCGDGAPICPMEWLSMFSNTLEQVTLKFARKFLQPITRNLAGSIRMRNLRILNISYKYCQGESLRSSRSTLELPVLESLSINGKLGDRQFLACLFVPSLEKLSISLASPSTQSTFCRRLPQLLKLKDLELSCCGIDAAQAMATLTANPQVPLRSIRVSDSAQDIGEELVRLCQTRTVAGRVKISKIHVTRSRDLLPEHKAWFQEHVENFTEGHLPVVFKY